MKSNSINTLGYIGEVTINLKQGNRYNTIKVHNQGTTSLGLFLAKALVGNFNKQDTPQWFKFEYQDTNSGQWNSLLRGTIPLTGGTYIPIDEKQLDTKVDPSSTIGKVKFVAVAQSNNVRVTSVTGKLLRLSIWDGNVVSNVLAEIKGDNPSTETNQDLQLMYTALTGGQDAVINWTMYITNTLEISSR
mgnify:CR=1 FL=1